MSIGKTPEKQGDNRGEYNSIKTSIQMNAGAIKDHPCEQSEIGNTGGLHLQLELVCNQSDELGIRRLAFCI